MLFSDDVAYTLNLTFYHSAMNASHYTMTNHSTAVINWKPSAVVHVSVTTTPPPAPTNVTLTPSPTTTTLEGAGCVTTASTTRKAGSARRVLQTIIARTARVCMMRMCVHNVTVTSQGWRIQRRTVQRYDPCFFYTLR